MADGEVARRAEERLGQVLAGKYRLDRVLGIGGMAVVYLATHRNRARLAIKMLLPELSVRADVRARFRHEAYAANTVKHPGVVVVVDDDVTEDGAAFLVMELLDGATADQIAVACGGRMPAASAVAVAHQVLDVLDAAHEAGIVHRDIKPMNLFVTRDGTVKVLDFGIARVLDLAPDSARATAAGTLLGTPAFMAPEQALAKSQEVDARTDVWSVGASLFALLTGRDVHQGSTGAELLVHAATRHAPSVAEIAPDTPAPIARVVDRALAFDKEARWPSAATMRDALAAACRESLGEIPSRDALAALVTQTSPGQASRVSEELASAPTLRAESIPAPSDRTRTTAPTSSSDRAPRTFSGWRWSGVVLAGAAAAVLLLGIALRPLVRPGSSLPAPAASSSATVAPVTVDGGAGQVVVLVLGIQNRTADPILDDTPAQVLAAIVGQLAGIDALHARDLHELAEDLGNPPDAGDEHVADTLVARGLRTVLLRGALTPQGPGFVIDVTATTPDTGAKVWAGSALASDRDGVVPALVELARGLDTALGATASALGAGTDSLEAYHEAMLARFLANSGQPNEAFAHLQRAIAIDPAFASAHAQYALALQNAGRISEAGKEFDLALTHMERLGPRAKDTLVAEYDAFVGNFDGAVAAGEALNRRWPLDAYVESNLAISYFIKRDFVAAATTARRAVEHHPRNIIAVTNLSNFLLTANDLEGAASVGKKAVASFASFPPPAILYVALADVLLGRRDEASAYYERLGTEPSYAATAAADLAIFDGRLEEAASILRKAIVADTTAKRAVSAAAKKAMLAEVLGRRGDRRGAVMAAEEASASADPPTLYAAAEVELAAGRVERALTIAAPTGARAVRDAELYAKLVEADALRVRGKLPEAKEAFLAALKKSDSWLVHLGLARTYVALGDDASAKAELEICDARPGEAAMVYLDDSPTLRYVPLARNELRRVRARLGLPPDGGH